MTSTIAPDTPDRGPSPIAAVAAMLGVVAAVTVGALALGSSTPAGASGLERFASCEELRAWTEDVQADFGRRDGLAVGEDDAVTDGGAASGATGAPVPTFAAESAGREGTAAQDLAGSDETGGTNTVVAGVDEIDIVDRVSADRLLVARNGVLALVALDDLATVSEVRGLPFDARISADGGIVFAAGTSVDGTGVEVLRIRLDGDALVADGTWSSPGYLLDARRTGDRLHVVAVDQPFEAVPFEGGPVPCDQVWHPVAPATTPAATMVATLPASGALAPVAAAQVTGSAGNLLVTQEAVYVATESWSEDGTVTSGVHRFAIDGLAPTGSGSVPGSVAGPFALDEHDGTLRIATNAGGGFVGRPMPVEGDVVLEASAAPAQEEAQEPTATTSTTPPDGTTTTTEPDATTTSTTTEPAPTTTTVPETTTTAPETTTTTVVEDPSALAEVFVLDLEGDLDLLGRTGRFGHDFETIHGVRFVGDVAYVVTFRQTDPFWVVDLADAAAPRVVGELQIPGFSGYLHPAGEGRVVGFGPDGSGAVAARLFDVADPAAPSVLDEIRLGDETPAAFDHHAFVGLDGGRFAVPVTDYPDRYLERNCGVEDQPVPLPQPQPIPPIDPGTGGGTEPAPPVCEVVPVGGGTGVAVLAVDGGRLSLVGRELVEGRDLYGERVVQAPSGTWLVLGWDRLVATDGRELVLPTP